MTNAERQRFDELFDRALQELPAHLHELIEEVPVIVEDEPDAKLLETLANEAMAVTPGVTLRELMKELREELCGLHSGPMLTERSVEDGHGIPEEIRIFRRGIVTTAGGWNQPQADEAIVQEIEITLLHEIGHHFGLEEDDLEELGYE